MRRRGRSGEEIEGHGWTAILAVPGGVASWRCHRCLADRSGGSNQLRCCQAVGWPSTHLFFSGHVGLPCWSMSQDLQ